MSSLQTVLGSLGFQILRSHRAKPTEPFYVCFFFSCVLSRPQACGGETVTLQLAHMYPRKTVIITRELV